MERMKEKVTSKLSESQYGFRPGRGTVDAIFILQQIIEKAKEKIYQFIFTSLTSKLHSIQFGEMHFGRC